MGRSITVKNSCLYITTRLGTKNENCLVTIPFCREIFGLDGRLIEIMSQADQDLAVNITMVAENMINFETDKLPVFWWSG